MKSHFAKNSSLVINTQKVEAKMVFSNPQIPHAVLRRVNLWMKIWYFLKEWNSEIPCLVIELPASGATPMTNPAYNGEAQFRKKG